MEIRSTIRGDLLSDSRFVIVRSSAPSITVDLATLGQPPSASRPVPVITFVQEKLGEVSPPPKNLDV